ncbi:MAG: coiled-coil domain-containing protein [Treponema sp.]
MANIEKDILILKRKLEEFNGELTASYKRLGKKLLLSFADCPTLPIDKDMVLEYNKMLEERSLLTNNILEIKSSNERLTELYKFKKQISKSLKETDSSISKLKARFALAFYKSFKDLNCFSTLDNEIEKIEAEIEELLSSTETLNEEKKEAGFLGKFNINRKIAGNKFKASMLKKNIEKKLCKHSNEIFVFEEVRSLFNEGKMTDEIKEIYKTILEEETSKKDLDNRICDIEEEERFIIEKLESLCKGVAYLKQVSNLNLKIKKIDENVDEILKNVAIKFASPFDDSANPATPDSSVYEPYSDDIQEIINIKLQLKTINYNIEYCNLNSKKDSISNKITYMNKAIENCKEEIKNYEARIETLKEDIEASNKEKEEIKVQLNQLEELIKEGK